MDEREEEIVPSTTSEDDDDDTHTSGKTKSNPPKRGRGGRWESYPAAKWP